MPKLSGDEARKRAKVLMPLRVEVWHTWKDSECVDPGKLSLQMGVAESTIRGWVRRNRNGWMPEPEAVRELAIEQGPKNTDEITPDRIVSTLTSVANVILGLQDRVHQLEAEVEELQGQLIEQEAQHKSDLAEKSRSLKQTVAEILTT